MGGGGNVVKSCVNAKTYKKITMFLTMIPVNSSATAPWATTVMQPKPDVTKKHS